LIVFLRNILFSFKPIFAWDMIPRFSIEQIVENSFYLWDSYINRPNFRAIQSFSSIWLLYYQVQWIGIFLSYGLFLLSLYLFNNQLAQLFFPHKKTFYYSLSAIIGSIPAFLFIVLNEGYWYHSIILSIGFLCLILFFSMRYIFIKNNEMYLLAILLLFCFNSMISFNYITLILVLFLYCIIRFKKIFTKKILKIYREDKILFFSIIGFLLYIIRVVLPTISSSSFIEQEVEYELAQLNPSVSFVPIYRIAHFFNLTRFDGYLSENSTLILFFLFPILAISFIIFYYKKIRRNELFLWLIIIIIFSIFSLQGSGFYEIANSITNIFNNEKFSEIITLPLRKPTKWALIIGFSYGSFITLILTSLIGHQFSFEMKYKRYVKYVPFILVSILIFIPFFLSPIDQIHSGDLGGALEPVEIPNNYEYSKNSLGFGGTHIFPVHIERPSILLENSKITDEFFIYYYDSLSYEAGGFDSYPFNVKYLGMLYSGLVLNKISNISNLMTPFGIKNIVFDKSVSYTIPNTQWQPRLFFKDEISNIESSLDYQKDLKSLYSDQIINAYQTNQIVTEIRSSINPLVNFLDYHLLYMDTHLIQNPVINIDAAKNINDYNILIMPYKNPIIPIINNKCGNIITSNEITFSSQWDSYRDAYIGIDPLSLLYKKYFHLGFPTYSTYAYATDENGGLISINKQFSNNEYHVFGRLAGNSNITITVNNQKNIVNIHSEKFDFFDLGSYFINNDKLNFNLRNDEGILVFDFLYFISDQELRTQKKIFSKTDNHLFIYPFEAETDLNYFSSDIEFSKYASSLNQIKLGGYAWQEIDILRNSSFQLGIKGKGDFLIQIDNKSRSISIDNTTSFTDVINLTQGNNRLYIYPMNQTNMVSNPSFEIPLFYIQVIPTYTFESESLPLEANWDYTQEIFSISLNPESYQNPIQEVIP
jgi:hypothetical protein